MRGCIHPRDDAGRGGLDEFVRTEATGGESLRRYPPRAGDVLVADCGHAHLAALSAIGAVPAHFVVRGPWNRFAFRTEAGEVWDLLAFLMGEPAAQFVEAFVTVGADGGGFGARPVALRQSPAAAEAARRRIPREAQRKGKTSDARTLECAGSFFVLPTLPSGIPAEQVLAIYPRALADRDGVQASEESSAPRRPARPRSGAGAILPLRKTDRGAPPGRTDRQGSGPFPLGPRGLVHAPAARGRDHQLPRPAPQAAVAPPPRLSARVANLQALAPRLQTSLRRPDQRALAAERLPSQRMCCVSTFGPWGRGHGGAAAGGLPHSGGTRPT